MTLQTHNTLETIPYRTPAEPLAGVALVSPDDRGGRAAAWRVAGLMFLLSLLMHLPFLTMTPLAGTEGHRSLSGHGMARSGQWLVPMLFGRPYLAKPPLHYWLIAASESLLKPGAAPNGHVTPADLFVWRLPSAINGGLLAAVVCLFAWRWFGRTAGWVAGGCAVGMIALWGERQVADLDSTNNLASTLAALCTVELLFGQSKRPRLWLAFTALAVGATLMTKGAAGFAILIGVWLWKAVIVRRERQIGRLASPRFWAPPLLGLLIFGGYILAVWLFLRHRGIIIDWGGLREGAKMMDPSRTKRHLLKALRDALLVPPSLLLYALPVSLAMPAWFLLPVRRVTEDREWRIGTALAAAVPIAWGVGLLTLMVNPRYGYPTLPALCPLAGAAAVAALRLGGKAAEALRVTVVGVAVTLAGAGMFLAVAAWKQPGAKPYLVAATVLALATAVWVARRMSASATAWRPAAGLLVLAALVSVPFGFQRVLARTPASGLFMVRDLVARAGERPKLAVGFGLTWKPEIFFYADAQTTSYVPTIFIPANVRPGTWVFLNQDEYKAWRRALGDRLNHDKLFRHGGESDYYLAWYGAPEEAPAPAPFVPTHAPAHPPAHSSTPTSGSGNPGPKDPA